MAKVIENLGLPALVMAHNKTLAAQLYHEFKAHGFRPPSALDNWPLTFEEFEHRVNQARRVE